MEERQEDLQENSKNTSISNKINSPDKQIRKVYSYQEKYDILQMLQTMSPASICEKLNINIVTLRKWRRNKLEIQAMVKKNSTKDLKKNRKTIEIDEKLYSWYLQAEEKKMHISGKILQKEAMRISKELGCLLFRVSIGWIDGWKIRKNVKLRQLYNSNEPSNTNSSANPKKKRVRKKYSCIQKEEILKKLETTSKKIICKEYNISRTLLNIWKSEQIKMRKKRASIRASNSLKRCDFRNINSLVNSKNNSSMSTRIHSTNSAQKCDFRNINSLIAPKSEPSTSTSIQNLKLSKKCDFRNINSLVASENEPSTSSNTKTSNLPKKCDFRSINSLISSENDPSTSSSPSTSNLSDKCDFRNVSSWVSCAENNETEKSTETLNDSNSTTDEMNDENSCEVFQPHIDRGKKEKKHYSYEEKFKALQVLETMTIAAASKKLNIGEMSLSTWKKRKLEIQAMNEKNETKNLVRQRKTAEIADKLYSWCLEAQKKRIYISEQTLREEAIRISKESGELLFKASDTWLRSWYKIKNFDIIDFNKNAACFDHKPQNNTDDDSYNNLNDNSKNNFNNDSNDNSNDKVSKDSKPKGKYRLTFYSYHKKSKILKKLETTPIRTVSKEYNIKISTLKAWKKNKKKILEACDKNNVEDILYSWYLEAKRKGNLVTDTILQQQASRISKQLDNLAFMVEHNWLDRWKRSRNIPMEPDELLPNNNFDNKNCEKNSEEKMSIPSTSQQNIPEPDKHDLPDKVNTWRPF